MKGYGSRAFRSLFILFLLSVSLAAPVLAEVIILDGDDCSDWARVLAPYVWRHKDSCLNPNGLLKFDISQVPSNATIIRADLNLFVERAGVPSTVSFWQVTQDDWRYGVTPIDALWNWPTSQLIATRTFADTTAFSIDVTTQLRQELLTASRDLSVKMTGDVWDFRISSPLAPRQWMRPSIRVEYAQAGHLLFSDLAVSTADIRFSPMRPVPGQPVTLSASVRNIGNFEARNVTVTFYDGVPSAATQIGAVLLNVVPGGGGSAVASVVWRCVRGVHDIYVVANSATGTPEQDQANNTDFRPYYVTDALEYEVSTESFEHPAFRWYQTDFDVPRGCSANMPKAFYLNRSAGEVYHGDHALELFLDGTGDDGTIWIERAVPVDPHTRVQVKLNWELFRYSGDMAFAPVVYVGVLDPEKESDFTHVIAPVQEGWTLVSYDTTVDTGPYDMVYIAVGLTVAWETPGTFYFDLVNTSVRPILGLRPEPEVLGINAGSEDGFILGQSLPNPSSGDATIMFRLPQPGPVSLSVYDTEGRLIKSLLDGSAEAGEHRVRWDGTDLENRPAASGVYAYQLISPGRSESRKLLLIH